MTESPLQKFQGLLRDLFQFDCADLDFGIYRILNHKRDAIERFIEETLPKTVKSELQRGAVGDEAAAAEALESARARVLEGLGQDALDPDGNLSPQYRTARYGRQYLQARRMANRARNPDALATEVFNHLYSFFNRYYDNGDFISKRRYSKEPRYAIPYNGEEVLLHWANADQYYIKTTDRLHNYEYKTKTGVRVRFDLVDGDVEHDNIKGKEIRFFVAMPANAVWDEKSRTLTAPFEYRPLTDAEKTKYASKQSDTTQNRLNAAAAIAIHAAVHDAREALARPAPPRPEANAESAVLLEHHLRQYTRRNTSDFFIHKDLAGFLTRELDFYLKNEILALDIIEAGGEERADAWFELMRLLRSVGSQIIAFLAQVENLQKKLWEKRKFIVDAQYIITLGQIPTSFHEEIASNDDQWAEWQTLLGIDVPPRPERSTFLKHNSTLPLDTTHFSADFVDSLLSTYADMDSLMDGLLIHSENFQATTLLHETLRSSVVCMYIDPPYNTENGSSSRYFLYKDRYRRSSWLSMMDSRLRVARNLLVSDGVLFVSIDEHEVHRAVEISQQILPERIGIFTWIKKKKGSHLSKTIRDMTEFVLGFCRDKSGLELYGEMAYADKAQPIVKRSNTVKLLIFPPCSVKTALPDADYEAGRRGTGTTALQFLRPITVRDGTVTTEIYVNGPFVWTQPMLDKELDLGSKVNLSKKFGFNVLRAHQKDRTKTPSTLLDKAVGIGTNEDASAELISLFGQENVASYPKPISLPEYLIRSRTYQEGRSEVMDTFAGSGTTGHAVMRLNRSDGQRRRFTLVEMDGVFCRVTVPRMKKVAFAPHWKDGKPIRPATPGEFERGPRIIRYVRLESYEDALDNLEFDDRAPRLPFDDYEIRYMLDWETKRSDTMLNVGKLRRPFDYKLNARADGTTVRHTADLPETFNFLIGLQVRTRRVHRRDDHRYLVYRGTTRAGRETAVIWRDIEGWAPEEFGRENTWVEAQGLTEGADVIYVNGDSVLAGAQSLDPEFKRRMFAPVPA